MKHERVLWGNIINDRSYYDHSGSPMYFYYCLNCGSEIISLDNVRNRKQLLCPKCKSLLDRSISGTYLVISPENFFNKETKELVNIYVGDYRKMSADEKEQFEKAYCKPSDNKMTSEIFEYMKQQRISKNSGKIKEQVESLVTTYEALPYDGNKTDAESIKSNPDILKQYIDQLIKLESSIYSTKQRIENLYRLQIAVEEEIKVVNYSFTIDYREAVKRAKDAMKKLPTEESYAPLRPKEPVAPEEPVLKEPGLFNRKKILAENEESIRIFESKKKEYLQAMEEYSAAVKEFEKNTLNNIARAERLAQADLEKATSQLKAAKASPPNSVEAEEKRMIDAEIEEAKEMLRKLVKGKNELYSYNIIYGKYRDIVSLASFYEYLASGRCDSLEGRDGAYNIYENEIRTNQIISQLSDVLSSLEQIKKGQYMVYSMLNEISSSLSSLESTTNDALSAMEKMQGDISRIAHNSKVIAYNTERTAFYAKKNQELTNALGFMVAIK